MDKLFIRKIKINKVRNLTDFSIPLADDVRKNLIITGKNGTGKSSLLKELKVFINKINNGDIEHYAEFSEKITVLKEERDKTVTSSSDDSKKIRQLDRDIAEYQNWLNQFGGTTIDLNDASKISEYYKNGDFITLFLEAKRDSTYFEPRKKEKDFFIFKPVYSIEEIAGKYFVQYLADLKQEYTNANNKKDFITAGQIDNWFKIFEKNIFGLFDSSEIKLEFDAESYNFNFIENDKAPYNFSQLSDGYTQTLSIITELIARMKIRRNESYDVQGIVLIDEIETHLHVELQKKILPFLIKFFPNIQFIVTTHSPFILNSIENAVICDLEKKIVTTDLSGYSYSALIESYFSTDKYSGVLKEKVEEYEQLMEIEKLSDDQKDTLFELKQYLNEIPKFASDELAVKLQQIKLNELNKKMA